MIPILLVPLCCCLVPLLLVGVAMWKKITPLVARLFQATMRFVRWLGKAFVTLLLVFVAVTLVILVITGGVLLFRAPAAPAVLITPAVSSPLTPVPPAILVPGSTGPCYVRYTTPGGSVMTLTVGKGRTDSQANGEGVLTVTCVGGSNWIPTWTPYAPAATAVPLTATAVPLTATPTASPTAVPTSAPTTIPSIVGACASNDVKSFEYFQCFTAGFTDVALHGALIDRLDTLYLGVKREFNGGTITTGSSDVVALWMGDYINPDPTQGGKLTPYLVDGDTGVWLIKPNTTVNIPVGFAYVRLNGWTGETVARPGTPALAKGNVEAQDDLQNSLVLPVITQYMGTDRLFAELDFLANGNPDTRIRNGWYSEVKTHEGKTLVWTKCGEVSLGWALITEANGKCLYVAKVSGKLEVMYPFSGLQLEDVYPNFNTLPSVTASAAPAETNSCVPNKQLADIVNTYRQSDELYLELALLPSATHPAGTYPTLWNTFTVTMDNVGGTNQLIIDQFNTFDGFRGLYFTTRDGITTFSGMSATITLCDGPFSPADPNTFPWWGRP